MSDRPMISWIFENEEYTNLYHEYFSQFISDFFDNGYVEKIIDDTVKMISPYVKKDPTKFCDYDSFVLGASTMKQFCQLRAESVRGQLNGTISSSDTQSSLSSVDASGINISDMGSMSMGGRGDMPGGFERPQNKPEQNPVTEPTVPEETTSVPEQEEEPTETITAPDIPDFGGEFPASPPDGMNPFGNLSAL